MTLRLTGWQRLGIVLSTVWFLAVCGAAIWEWYSPYKGFFFYELPADWSKAAHGDTAIIVEWAFNREKFLILCFLPVIAAWVGAYLLAAAVKWIGDGFKA